MKTSNWSMWTTGQKACISVLVLTVAIALFLMVVPIINAQGEISPDYTYENREDQGETVSFVPLILVILLWLGAEVAFAKYKKRRQEEKRGYDPKIKLDS